MFEKKRLLALITITGLVLASCNIGGGEETPAPAAVLELATLQLTGQADTSVPFTSVGQVVNISLALANTGTGSVTGAIAWTGASPTCPAFNTAGNLNDSFDPGEKVSCLFGYPLAQADLDRGAVTIVISANVNGINSNQATITVPVVQPKALTLTVSANPTTYGQIGQEIIFTYIIKNSGSQTLGPDQFIVTDTLISATPIPCGAAGSTIAPGATLTCTAKYNITAADMNAASISDLATASGGGASPSPAANATINKGAVTSSLVPGSTVQHKVLAGEWLWQIARCYGVTPQAIIQANTLVNPHQLKPDTVLTIPNVGSASTPFGPPCVVSHTVTATDTWSSIAAAYNADITILQMVNGSTLTVGSKIKVPRNSASGASVPPPAQTKALTLSTTANPLTYELAGQQITLTYVIKNSGTAILGPDQFTVKDTLISQTPFSCGAPTTLAPNASVTCSVIYTITQTDMNAASISNLATASGGGAGPSAVSTITINKGVKSLSLTTTPSTLVYEQAGQKITYNYAIKNSGSTNIGPAQFTVSDALFGATPLNCGAANTTLTPNTTVTCAFEYTISQADMNVASITNLATASGGGVGPSPAATVTINKAVRSLSLTVDVNSLTYSQVNQQITFTYTIRNTGNVPIGPTQFTVTDTLISPTAFNCGAPNTTLAPNATVTCTATYTITQADLNVASITNLATASGGGVGPSAPAIKTINKQ